MRGHEPGTRTAMLAHMRGTEGYRASSGNRRGGGARTQGVEFRVVSMIMPEKQSDPADSESVSP